MTYSIETSVHGLAVYKIDKYPSTSVLAGQDRKTVVDFYDTLDLAKADYPNAIVGFHDPQNHIDGSFIGNGWEVHS